ncbi:Acetyl esterase/lipase [Bryocella elongata]|uniref:Acetyl esterase/lipase n=1 Tax=Bryocella elongata TaxID=863522 RepID=A0A1H6BW62_9BACT|nr:alpha/beta hydrolase [Bryocella elongata]SEG64920.1 Acetyl esterase/lipase [Bryocella elongata]
MRSLPRLPGASSLLAVVATAASLFSAGAQQPAASNLVHTKMPTGFGMMQPLWDGKAPGAVGAEDDDQPKLFCYPATGPGPHTAVVVLPGGGYNHLVMEQEGAHEARWLQTHNISACVLQYRLSPRYLYPWAMVDGQRAMRLMRFHAKDWGFRPDAIGVWGFSAGGHLAAWLATADPHGDARFRADGTYGEAVQSDAIDKVSARPDFAILNYARTDLDPSIPGTNGMEALTGKNAPQVLVDALNPVLHVTKETSPSLIYATERDEKVNSLNATSFFNALQKAGVDAEVHVFQQGPHGTHMGDDQPRYPELAVYPLIVEHWLQLHGWLTAPTAEK